MWLYQHLKGTVQTFGEREGTTGGADGGKEGPGKRSLREMKRVYQRSAFSRLGGFRGPKADLGEGHRWAEMRNTQRMEKRKKNEQKDKSGLRTRGKPTPGYG